MQPLPLVDSVDGSTALVPVSDASAVVLARTLLESATTQFPPSSLLKELAGQLSSDPALALWVLWTAQALGHSLPMTAEESARWLFRNATKLCSLHTWQKADCTKPVGLGTQALEGIDVHSCGNPGPQVGLSGGTGDPTGAKWDMRAAEAERLADLVANRVTLAELAARLATAQFPEPKTAEEARWAALVFRPADWEFAVRLERLAEMNSPAVDSTVRQAVSILAGEVPPSHPGADPEAIAHLGGQAKSRWLAPIPGVDGLLSAVAGCLANSQQFWKLRQEFSQKLEEEKLDALAEFAAGAGHEINNPLANISGRAQLLLRGEADPERRRELATIVAQAQRAHRMIADLWLFARPPQPQPQTVDLVELAERVIAESRALAQEDSVELLCGGRGDPVWVHADPVQLHVALGALVVNAIEAVGKKGRVEVRVESSGQEALVHVMDDGPGIPPEVRRHLFDPFFSGRQAGRGLGLGLSKAWRVVRNHGGRIEVADIPRGAALVIVLPLGTAGRTKEPWA